MNILILTGKFGMGHYSAAIAIKEHLLLENPNYNILVVDFLEYMFPAIHKCIYNVFNFVVNRCHSIYNILNNISAKSTTTPLKKVVVKKIRNLLDDNNIDMVISTLPLASKYISAYKSMFNNNLILNTFITDVEAKEEWITENTNLYFVASPTTKEFLISKNVPENKIIISGIPVKISFTAKHSTHKIKNILIMGGGLGLIPYANKFLKELETNSQVKTTVILGNNKKLLRKLKAKYSHINLIGFTNEVYKYMQEADLIITKAGGITTFEAINTEIPMLIIKPFLTQEIGNAKYIEQAKIGKVIWQKNSNLLSEINTLLNDDVYLNEIKTNMQNIKKSFAKTSYTINLKKKRMI